ncbi:MAG: hypothetical protein KDC38_16485, partial [Planctomycetes bacterium]|nr:hypothetical protein [Planctomycetota bacterium]
SINSDVAGLFENLAAGESVDAKVQASIARENEKLKEYAIKLIGKLPTNHPGNGEFSHPISVANMVSASLDLLERPLSTIQREEITRLGDEYDEAYALANASYGESTYQLERFLDEFELKERFVSSLYDSLDPDQADAVVDPRIRGRVQLDALSPSVMLMGRTQPMAVRTRAELRDRLIDRAAELLPVGRDRLSQLAVFDDWVRELDPILEPQPRHLLDMYRADEVTVAGRAQLRAMKQLAETLELDESERGTLRDLQLMLVPRMRAEE